MFTRRLSSSCLPSLSAPARPVALKSLLARTFSRLVGARPAAQRRLSLPTLAASARRLSVEILPEGWNEFGHVQFSLTMPEQQASGLPPTIGFSMCRKAVEGDRPQLFQLDLLEGTSPAFNGGSRKLEMPSMLVVGRPIRAHRAVAGRKMVTLELGTCDAVKLKAAVDAFDVSRFDMSGVRAPNCVKFAIHILRTVFGFRLEFRAHEFVTPLALRERLQQELEEQDERALQLD